MCQLLAFPSSHIPRDVWAASWTSSLSLPFPWSRQICILSSYFPLLHLPSLATFSLDHSTDSKLTTYHGSSKESDMIPSWQSVPWKLFGSSKVLAILHALVFRSYCPCLECLWAFLSAVSNPQLTLTLRNVVSKITFLSPKVNPTHTLGFCSP